MYKNNNTKTQHILIFQQNGSGESKIKGIRQHGDDLFRLEICSIDEDLPPVVDDSSGYLPDDIKADLVLDYLKHLDLSHDLARMCMKKNIPVVSPGKKMRLPGVFIPPT